MSQRARPDADVVNDGWFPTPLYAQINPAIPHDQTFVTSPHVPPTRTFVVHLAPRAAPIGGPNADNTEVPAHQLTVRLDGTGFVYAVATLLNTLHGTDRFIKAVTWYNLTPGFKNYVMTLTRREAARIEDYTTLKVMITAFCEGPSCPSSSGSSSSSAPCSPIVGWGGAGWYCVENTGPNDCVVVELLNDDRCDTNVVICSGPYATESAAEAVCGPQPPPNYDLVCGTPCLLPDRVKVTITSPAGGFQCSDFVRDTGGSYVTYAANDGTTNGLWYISASGTGWSVFGYIQCGSGDCGGYCYGPLQFRGGTNCASIFGVAYECCTYQNQYSTGQVQPRVDATLYLYSSMFVLHVQDYGSGDPHCH
jgi:hypothetical protein